MEITKFNRRTVLKFGAGAVLAVAIGDQADGFAYEALAMRQYPQAEVALNPDSDRVILVVGGLGNDGIAIARGMRSYLLPIGSVIGVRYAQTNVNPKPLAEIITAKIEQYGLQKKTIDAYLNSAAGMIMVDPLKQLAQQKRLGSVIFDCSPHGAGDIKGLEGDLVRDHADILDHSRLISLASRLVSHVQQPAASDRAPGVPLEYARANRNAIIAADSITLGVQAAALDADIRPGSLRELADTFVFMHSAGTDPLVDDARAYTGWSETCGLVHDVTDPYRPPNSHAAGDDFPLGVRNVFEGVLSL